MVEGQRLIQATSDVLLGWSRWRGRDGRAVDFYVRQLWDGKASVDIARLTAKGLAVYGQACGWTLARGHARSGDRIALESVVCFDAAADFLQVDLVDNRLPTRILGYGQPREGGSGQPDQSMM